MGSEVLSTDADGVAGKDSGCSREVFDLLVASKTTRERCVGVVGDG